MKRKHRSSIDRKKDRDNDEDNRLQYIKNIAYDRKLKLELNEIFKVTTKEGEVLIEMEKPDKRPYYYLWREICNLEWIGQGKRHLPSKYGIPPIGK